MAYKLKCLLCNAYEDTNLVRIQEHAMNEHGYTQDDHRAVTQQQIEPGHFVYTMPDGKPWLDAQRTGTFVEGL